MTARATVPGVVAALAASSLVVLSACSSSAPGDGGPDGGQVGDAGGDAGADASGDASVDLDASVCATARCDHDCECFGLGFAGFSCDAHCCAERPRRVVGLCVPGNGAGSACACVGGMCDGPVASSCCRLPDGTIPDEFGPVCHPDAGAP